jgi:RNA-directed DNA polymerase
VDPVFHEDSFGYRKGRSALDAVAVCRERCWRSDWVIDLDIKGFFDNLPQDRILAAVAHHTDLKWVLLYVRRWLAAPVQQQDGSLNGRDKGTPQGAPISPLLSNLFMHYAFDVWITREIPGVRFERYCDDVIVHCASERQARGVREQIAGRLAEFGLELHPDKTRIVYCKDDDRRGDHDDTSFTFLGYTFRPRRAKNRWGKFFVSFPAGGQSRRGRPHAAGDALMASPATQ